MSLRSRSRTLLTLTALLVTVLVTPVAGAAADGPPATALALSAPGQARAGTPATFTATLTDPSTSPGTPISGAPVTLQQVGGTATSPVTTNSAGQATFTVTRPLGSTRWQAAYAGDPSTHAGSTSQQVTLSGVRYASAITLSGPARLVDEHSATLGFRWHAADGLPVSAPIVVYRQLGNGPFAAYTRLTTDAAGLASLRVTPRYDSRWYAVGATGSGWLATTSSRLFIDNLPQGQAVAYPRRAPSPAYTPLQPRATAAGAALSITTIPADVWGSMVGRTWHAGCPVGRSSLRLVRVNYWGFDGYRYRGEMVLNAAVAGRAGAALRDMYAAHLPLRRMYREDRFGWSARLHGANDYASMRADNSSGFNCRSVVNRPGVLSPHASGRAVDLNTWENPYRSATGLVPDRWWARHSDPRVAWRSPSAPVVRIWRSHGFRWTYGNVDSQHLDGRGQPLIGGFVG